MFGGTLRGGAIAGPELAEGLAIASGPQKAEPWLLFISLLYKAYYGDFHFNWVHSDGLELKNAGRSGGQWNKWWDERIDDTPLEDIKKEQWLAWREDSKVFQQELWVQYKNKF